MATAVVPATTLFRQRGAVTRAANVYNVKKHQQAVVGFLEANRISFQEVDITMLEEQRLWMYRNIPRDKLPEKGNPLPPQIFNEDCYCGDYEDFFQAKENNTVFSFLGLSTQPSVKVSECTHREREIHGCLCISSFCKPPRNNLIYDSTECDKIRLAGPSRCSGRVEVYHEDSWGTVCDDHWSIINADVVCRELGCGTVLEAKKGGFFGEGKHEIWLDDVQCTGHETSILKCPHKPLGENNCGHSEDAGVVCSEAVRVVNGSNRCNGRVEVFHDGHWKRVCRSDWETQEANIVCQEINCGSPVIQPVTPFLGEARNLDAVKPNCIGNETSISQCRLQEIKASCEDATIFCANSKPIRLKNGTHRCSGRVEVYHDGQWGTICDDRWGMQEANVACREMNCGNAIVVRNRAFYGRGLEQVWMDDTECTGLEKSLADCPHRGFGEHDCDHSEDAGVECSGNLPLRLVNGTDRCSGRVELLHNGVWGTVCDDQWDISNAQVVCRAMDCGTAQAAKSSAYFGQGQGDIWLDDVQCIGNETELTHCKYPSIGENNCGHGEDAGVVCSATIRLIGGTDQCSGRVEFHHGDQWSPAYNLNWGMNEATVVCREMNCGEPVKASGSFGQSGEQRGYRISCSGRETSLTHCSLTEYVKTSNDNIGEAGVECSGNVKLNDGSNRCVGRVEFFDKGQWGNVCGETWDLNDAAVVCRQLNCGKAHKITTMTEYGHGTGQTWIDQIECNGLESTLNQCQKQPFSEKTCNITSVAGVICTGSLEVRMSNDKDDCSGRVEVRHGDVWQTVCDSDWTLSKAQVVCERSFVWSAAQVNALVEWRFSIKDSGELCVMMNGK
ncbi:hypothetical protein F2P81_024112 [Scophthalmus maximus]|uniref:Soluble scavenger receptor cysteine-rich domain-containing protein SSC5D n=1 Tax=Scophthalmus maximus TaxID=52904 RepID=A0A6A4RWJ5_SCOMX|nr:hypothetical protein F2P81_024112 [Scophthalmus maximus]